MINRILAVDDEQSWRDVLQLVLEEKGREVLTADSKEQALELMRRLMFDILIVDLRLVDKDPGNTDGLELLKQVRRDYPDEPVQAIILTGYPTITTSVEAVGKYGAVDYIEKSASETCREQLRGTVEKALSKKPLVSEELYQQRAFAKETVLAVVEQLCPPRRVETILRKVFRSKFLPLSTEMIGPEWIYSANPACTIAYWSRAQDKAVAALIQYGGPVTGLSGRLMELCQKWSPEIDVDLDNESAMFASSCVLNKMTFAQFSEQVKAGILTPLHEEPRQGNK